MDIYSLSDSELRELIENKSNLFSSYSVRNKSGEFVSVVDVDSVLELLKSIINEKSK
jgi:hypothetical protein